MFKGKVLLDGDIIAYRAAFSTQDMFPQDAESKVDELMDYILGETLMFPDPNDYKVFLTGSGNFRYDIAKSFPYKGNRGGVEKPIHLPVTRERLVSRWGAIVSEGEEADAPSDPEPPEAEAITIKHWVLDETFLTDNEVGA
jgi:hypothetical protein